METKIPYKIYLEEQEMPKQWYNVRADMKKKTSSHFKPRHLKAGDAGGAVRYFLHRAGKAGAG